MLENLADLYLPSYIYSKDEKELASSKIDPPSTVYKITQSQQSL